jgi:hypothetical protein
MMAPEEPEPSFAPADLTDGRRPGDWMTRYKARDSQNDGQAQSAIRFEAIYLACLLYVVPLALFIIWHGYAQHWLRIDVRSYPLFKRYAYAWLGGLLGGTLFDIKWLYHSVAKDMWNLDRRLWRLFAPHLSAGLAFAVVGLISSGILQIFDQQAIGSPPVALTMGFLVGYFSDSATAKLTELAETLFGKTRQTEPKK